MFKEFYTRNTTWQHHRVKLQNVSNTMCSMATGEQNHSANKNESKKLRKISMSNEIYTCEMKKKHEAILSHEIFSFNCPFSESNFNFGFVTAGSLKALLCWSFKHAVRLSASSCRSKVG